MASTLPRYHPVTFANILFYHDANLHTDPRALLGIVPRLVEHIMEDLPKEDSHWSRFLWAILLQAGGSQQAPNKVLRFLICLPVNDHSSIFPWSQAFYMHKVEA